jgi:Flp pilus assembly protein TadG
MRTRSARRGATALEFALLLPVFCAILFGVIEYGWVFYQQSNVVAATRDALRVAITLPQDTAPDPATAAFDEVRANLTNFGYTPEQLDAAIITGVYNGETPDETLTVTVTMPYQPIIGFVPAPQTINATMTMRLELQD